MNETDTAGNEIYRPVHCRCGLTCGCKRCNPVSFEFKKLEDNFVKVEDVEVDTITKEEKGRLYAKNMAGIL